MSDLYPPNHEHGMVPVPPSERAIIEVNAPASHALCSACHKEATMKLSIGSGSVTSSVHLCDGCRAKTLRALEVDDE